MGEIKLTNDSERAAWLQCLQAAAAIAQSLTVLTAAGGLDPAALSGALLAVADDLYEDYRHRCER